MKKNVCFLCDREFVFEKWYGKCDYCRILRPESKEHMFKEMESILALRAKLSEYLHDLEQKQISYPEEMTNEEKEERNIWAEHNNLYNEIEELMDNYNSREYRFHKIYPKLYSYVKIADKIKQMYR